MFVHATAIIGLGPMLIYIVLNHKKYLGAPKSRKRFVIFGVMCMVVMFVPLIKVAMGLGLLSGFGFYTEGQSGWPIYLTAFLLIKTQYDFCAYQWLNDLNGFGQKYASVWDCFKTRSKGVILIALFIGSIPVVFGAHICNR